MTENICRICLEANAVVSLFDKQGETSPSEKLVNKLKIEVLDLGSSYICNLCLEELETSVKFFEKCENANKILIARCYKNDNITSQNENESSYLQESIDEKNGYSTSIKNWHHTESRRGPHSVCGECGSRRRCSHRPLRCPHCQKEFSRRFNYNVHVGRHLGLRPPTVPPRRAPLAPPLRRCPHPRCARTYTTTHSLNRHLLTHTGDKPHACDECGKRFTTKYSLKEHMRTHTGSRPYLCSVCGASFTTNKLAAHSARCHNNSNTRTVTATTPRVAKLKQSSSCLYRCLQCASSFAHKQSLNRHVRRRHHIHTKTPHQTEDTRINQMECLMDVLPTST